MSLSPAKRKKKLLQLSELAKDVAKEMIETPALHLTKDQEQALYAALRTLDLYNDYEAGDDLRLAFGFELNGLRSRKYDPECGEYDQKELNRKLAKLK